MAVTGHSCYCSGPVQQALAGPHHACVATCSLRAMLTTYGERTQQSSLL